MKRSKPPVRRTRPSRARKPVRARKKNPAKRRFAKRRCKAFREWICLRPCLLAGNLRRPGHVCVGVVEPSHIGTQAAGHDDLNEIIPLCSGAHRLSRYSWHMMGRDSFARYWGFGGVSNLRVVAILLTQEFLRDFLECGVDTQEPEAPQ